MWPAPPHRPIPHVCRWRTSRGRAGSASARGRRRSQRPASACGRRRSSSRRSEGRAAAAAAGAPMPAEGGGLVVCLERRQPPSLHPVARGWPQAGCLSRQGCGSSLLFRRQRGAHRRGANRNPITLSSTTFIAQQLACTTMGFVQLNPPMLPCQLPAPRRTAPQLSVATASPGPPLPCPLPPGSPNWPPLCCCASVAVPAAASISAPCRRS